jgi:regulator of replication initiation timing|tara:strand:- start:30 stop:212 length:183 start_codon:yes stop_codon:yes gene_type:complete
MKDDRGSADLEKIIETLQNKVKDLNNEIDRISEERENLLLINGELREELAHVRKALTRIP